MSHKQKKLKKLTNHQTFTKSTTMRQHGIFIISSFTQSF